MRHADDERGAVWRAPGSDAEANPELGDALADLDAAISCLLSLSMGGLSDADVTRALDAGTVAMSRVTAATAGAAGEADRRRLGDATGARHTAIWWAARSRLTRAEAARLVRLGRSLALPPHEPIGAALAAGRIHTDQAAVIVGAVDDLPSDVADPAVRVRAREVLFADAETHDARTLRILGRRVLDVVAPEIGETHEQRALEREERAAAAHARFVMVDDGHGRCHGRFTLPTLHGELLRTHLYALANPRRRPADARSDGVDAGDAGDARTSGPGPVITPELLGQALMDYVERYPADRLPDSGATNATVTVTMSLDSLITGLGVATLDSGGRISAGEARRLACGAGLVPAVLGSRSEVLDLGRTSRLFKLPQRRVMGLRDGGCTAEDCGMLPRVLPRPS
jgi:hypothetical protein